MSLLLSRSALLAAAAGLALRKACRCLANDNCQLVGDCYFRAKLGLGLGLGLVEKKKERKRERKFLWRKVAVCVCLCVCVCVCVCVCCSDEKVEMVLAFSTCSRCSGCSALVRCSAAEHSLQRFGLHCARFQSTALKSKAVQSRAAQSAAASG